MGVDGKVSVLCKCVTLMSCKNMQLLHKINLMYLLPNSKMFISLVHLKNITNFLKELKDHILQGLPQW